MRYGVLALTLLMMGIASAQAQSTDIRKPIRQMQNAWHTCLKHSYSIYIKTYTDRNAAVEAAFGACATEEDDLRELSNVGLGFAHLKAAMKQVLIDKGQLPHLTVDTP